MCFQEESSDESETVLPENLSLPKNTPMSADSTSPMSAEHAYLYTHPYSPYQNGRSPVDVLRRVFPNRRRGEVETVLQRCKGDVLQAIEMMVGLAVDFLCLSIFWWFVYRKILLI